MYKGYPFSRTTYYRRKKVAEALGCDIMEVPDGRGKHGKHVRGNEHHRWQAGKHFSSHGYVKIRVGKDHPLSDPNGYAYEHIMVWISAGRILDAGEVLHHINSDCKDNRLENLRRMATGEHLRMHREEKRKLLDGRTWQQFPAADGAGNE